MSNKNRVLPNVSIVTPTFRRIEFLPVLADCIIQQNYPMNKIEWVIVDGENDPNKFNDVPAKILEIKDRFKTIPKIVFHHSPMHQNNLIGGLRNKTNELAQGLIIVCMDDDDYYPPNRIIDAVKKLKYGKKSLAGCTCINIYDFDLDTMITIGPFGQNHGTNNTFAYTKKYANEHKYDPTIRHGEEPSFTNNFRNPMVQLDTKSCVIQLSHYKNTYNKRKLFDTAHWFYGRKESPYDLKYKVNNNYKITNYISEQKYADYLKICLPTGRHANYSNFDIVYYCGCLSIEWDPTSQSLGGSEQAVVELSSYWQTQGNRVAVYANIKSPTIYRGVYYYPYNLFLASNKYKNLILWRSFGFISTVQYNIKADYLAVDIHDLGCPPNLLEYLYKINHIYVKSDFHHGQMIRSIPFTAISQIIPKIFNIMNGIRIENFSNDLGIKRNPYRMCYASCYTRGLEMLLEYCFPYLKKIIPQAEFHIYYGYPEGDNWKPLKEKLEKLINEQDGVYEHGRVDMKTIIKEKYQSNFHLYYTSSPLETDCISIRESLITGCIPIISNENVFQERDGFKHSLPTSQIESYKILAENIAELMKNMEKCDQLRNQLKQSPTIVSWAEVGNKWLQNCV